jgi:hypothetical protein
MISALTHAQGSSQLVQVIDHKIVKKSDVGLSRTPDSIKKHLDKKAESVISSIFL